MELVYAFTDEYGAFGWKLDNPTVSTHFIITAVIVKESDVSEYEEKAEAIRSKYFRINNRINNIEKQDNICYN